MAPKAPGKGATTDQRLDYLTSLLESVVIQGSETRALLEETRGLLTKEREKVTILEATVTSLKKEMRTLQDTVNFREQTSRSLVIRVLGIQSSEDETNAPDPDKYLAKKVYDSLLHPILAGAKNKNFIKSIPSLSNTIVKATRLGRFNARSPSSSSSTPAVIITLTDPLLKSAIFRSKKQFLPSPSDAEKAAGIKYYLIAEDLTAPTFTKLRQLREHSKVDKAWTVEGRIRFTLTDDKDKMVHKVSSVFADTESLLP